MTGAWDSPDLARLLTVLAGEIGTLVPERLQRWLRGWYVARHPRDAPQHRRQHARHNIAHHYDLSNDLFATVPRRDDDLLLGALRRDPPAAATPGGPRRGPAPQDRPAARPHGGSVQESRVLEIGTGWGELAIRAAAPRRHGRTASPCRPSSRRWPGSGSPTAGLSDRVDVRADRLPRGPRQLRRRGVGRDDRGGRPRVPAVVLPDPPRPARARRPGRHPGDPDAARPDAGDAGHLHLDQQVHLPRRLPARRRSCSTRSCRDAGAAHRRQPAAFGPHYAETLRLWDEAFLAADVRPLGFDEVFRRMWHFYLMLLAGRLRLGLPRRAAAGATSVPTAAMTGRLPARPVATVRFVALGARWPSPRSAC